LSEEDVEKFKGGWKILRLRIDKGANALKTAHSVQESIDNPIEAEDLIGVTRGL